MEVERQSFEHPWSDACFNDELNSPNGDNCLAILYDSPSNRTIAGYLFFRLILDEMHIFKIAVRPQWRGLGIGEQILNSGFRRAKKSGANSSWLEVRPSNHPAMALYNKLGFSIIGRRKQYYSDTGEDALLLMKDLKEEI
jgi:ribosomal-protein-alanine N-acetyltransferase